MSVEMKAKKVRRGHSIPGLDNAYVIAIERERGYLGEDMVEITFNDALGGEGYLKVPVDHPIVVDQETPQWVGYP
jgi:hypothetical protein